MKLSEYMKNQWTEHAIYTAQNRAIPNVIDGLKPVQRFLLYMALQKCKNNWIKTEAIGSSVAEAGYHHGEQSACQALQLMTGYFCNNLCIFDGDGNFGNVLDPTPAAPRYTQSKISKIYDKLFKDTELAPVHEDEEHKPPKYYLPIIPYVLCNGIKGIATGYATNIFPYDPVSIIDILIDMTKGKPAREPQLKFYNTNCSISNKTNGSCVITGKFSINGNTVTVTEIPLTFTDEAYDAHLRKLLDTDKITSYENLSAKDKFHYIVRFKRGTALTPEKIIKLLKLSCTLSENLTTISENGKVKEWDSVEALIDYFYEFRINIIQQRISNKISYFREQIEYYTGLLGLTDGILTGKISFHNKTEDEMRDIIIKKFPCLKNYIEKVLDRPIRFFSKELIAKTEEALQDAQNKLKYYETTTKENEYRQDLNELKAALK